MIKRGGNLLAIVVAPLAAVLLVSILGARAPSVAIEVSVTPNEAARRVDVSTGGRPFTSYIWPERLKKPVLYP